ncbi:MAG: hypothetical protein SV429_08445 [Pseudomonadota bacterium]|nr:hypothetical protein [Pseudomonadota bacterium]MDY6841515.1 hypothetical protein [Pseudomonadota bacterium]
MNDRSIATGASGHPIKSDGIEVAAPAFRESDWKLRHILDGETGPVVTAIRQFLENE